MKKCSSLLPGLALIFMLFTPPAGLAGADAIIPEGTRLTLQLNNHLSTGKNNEGDSFTAVVTMPVYLGDRMLIPKGSVVNGSISRILRPGRFKGKAMMNLLFQTISIPGRGETPIVATLIKVDPEGNGSVRSEGRVEGSGSIGSDAGKVMAPGLTGAAIGVLAGGGRGAAIGGGIGSAIGLGAVFTSRGKDLEVKRGSMMDITLDRPLAIPPEVDNAAARNR